MNKAVREMFCLQFPDTEDEGKINFICLLYLKHPLGHIN